MISENQQPFRVHQFHHSVSPFDGISYQMFFIQSALKKIGVSGSIFASELHGISAPRAFKFSKEKIWDCDLLLIHHSHGNPHLIELSHVEIPKALVYHNIVLPHFFRHDLMMAELSQLGRKQLSSLRKETIASFTGSEFNLEELTKHHFPHPQILPIMDLSRDLGQPKQKKLRSRKDAPKNILFVGRVCPHKNQALLIKTFFYLKKNLPKQSKLILLGGQDPIYTEYLKLLIKQWGLHQDVKLTGNVNSKSLEQAYETADAMVCVSEHEGFCIPLVEAMSRQVPVFFLPKTGVKETMGKSGVALNTEDPMEISEIIYSCLIAPQAISTILKSQDQRLKVLASQHNAQKLQETLLNLLERLRT
ncbi:MAG: glycosyltransferase family 1 protein, partial [Chlamydiae bacterium]|nr:glycosyltransferase family 1 protein [Chlamydiota bacterium]